MSQEVSMKMFVFSDSGSFYLFGRSMEGGEHEDEYTSDPIAQQMRQVGRSSPRTFYLGLIAQRGWTQMGLSPMLGVCCFSYQTTPPGLPYSF